jgi:hypothetical protein
MTADPRLQLSLGELKRAAALLGLPDDVEIWVEQRPRADTGDGLLHASAATGFKSEPLPAGYARLIVTVDPN